MKRLKLLDIFSGTGGFSVGLEKAGFETVAFCENDKHCRKVLDKHWPDIPKFEDVTKVSLTHIFHGEDYLHEHDSKTGEIKTEVFSSDISVIAGGFPCFPSGTDIITSDGRKDIKNIEVGDLVLTHTGTYKKVSKTFNNGKKKLIRVTAQGMTADTTEEHPFYVRTMGYVWDNENRTNKRVFSEARWEQAKNLKKGDFLALSFNSKITEEIGVTEEEAFLMGRYIADGYIQDSLRSNRVASYNKKTILCIGKDKLPIFKKEYKKYQTRHTTESKNLTVTKVVISEDHLMGLCRSCGRGSVNKTIPEIFFSNTHLLKILLESYMMGDGCFTNNQYTASTVSYDLAMQLQRAVFQVYGAVAVVYKNIKPATCVIEGRTVNQRNSYNIVFDKKPKKQTRSKVLDGVGWIPFKDQENIEARVVYNFEVEEDHTYVANNIIVHNCTDVSVAGKKRGLFDKKIYDKHIAAGFTEAEAKEKSKTRSGLWTEYCRLINKIQPRWVIIENVDRLVTHGLEEVLNDLAKIRYDAEWAVIQASHIGAKHKRPRVWIVAYPCEQRCDGSDRSEGHVQVDEKRNNSHLSEEWEQCESESGPHGKIFSEGFMQAIKDSHARKWATFPNILRVVDGIQKGMDGSRQQRIKQMGNAIVPQIAEMIGREIIKYENEHPRN